MSRGFVKVRARIAAGTAAIFFAAIGAAPALQAAENSSHSNSTNAAAELSGLPDVVARGLEGYARGGAEAALAAWVAGGPLQSDDFVAAQAGGLHRIENFYGKYQGYEPIRVLQIAPRLKTVYLAMYFEKGAAFCYLLCYQTKDGQWVVSDFDGSTSPRKILPEYGGGAIWAGAASDAGAGGGGGRE